MLKTRLIPKGKPQHITEKELTTFNNIPRRLYYKFICNLESM